MTKKNILHMISPQENVSPFDVNMWPVTLVMTLLYHTPMLISPMSKLWYKMQFFQDPFLNAKKTGVSYVERMHHWL